MQVLTKKSAFPLNVVVPEGEDTLLLFLRKVKTMLKWNNQFNSAL